ncbi:hypothetical protein ASF17_00880 [Frigoribacterium sp. Leaf263]|uniref:TetR/AcrR family transcriptional regulator n=1 Tax=Frigoribacterium sp. Leaf263 TaxID=1736313 RepID=UPI0006FEFBD1|nr:TetR family transcriptional regulator [Frigoribacterium sp. Leaf263]KQO84138.1 hypothetical protein ASF17_00880 [Frigoribacterium sp. Leaf263]
MPRKPDPTRKPELLGQIIDHLRSRSIATVSFRTLAEALGVSTYVFVYHFGNRAELIAEIVRAVVGRHDHLVPADPSGLDAAGFRRHLEQYWDEASSERGLDLQRLEMEAALLEVVAGDEPGVARRAGDRWRETVAAWLVAQGVSSDDAAVRARAFVAELEGLLYDAVIGGHADEPGAVFTRRLDAVVESVGA